MQTIFASWRLLFVLTLGGILFPTALLAENYAFLVAVQDYDVKNLKKLNYTRNDILEFAKLLQQAGFKPQNVITLTDKPEEPRFLAEAERIRKQFDLLLSSIEAGDTLIVAFSGHGVQFEGEEKNFYCPMDADLEDKTRSKLIAISEIYDRLKECPAHKKLLLVDACRNDPLSEVKKSRATVSLKSVTRPQTEAVPKGVAALFSCSAGQESYEWPALKHGIFFHHILKGMQGAADNGDNELTLDELVAYSRKETQAFARINLDARQAPQLRSDFEGTWVLRKLSSGTDKEVASDATGMKFILIPAGKFLMGTARDVRNAEGEEPITSDEMPQHQVQITKSFYLGKYEVTRGEFRKFVAATNYETDAEKEGYGGSGFSGSGEDFTLKQKPAFTWRAANMPQTDEHPVINVSWNDAVAFCKWLSDKEGATYRLPTEAEWEYACRAGSTQRWSCGDDAQDLRPYANVADRSWTAVWNKVVWSKPWDDGYPYSSPVGKFRPNAFGLYDMHGNAWEWCHDWYDAKYYANDLVSDPQGPSDEHKLRVARGGSWLGRVEFTRSAYRTGFGPATCNVITGFRVVRATKTAAP